MSTNQQSSPDYPALIKKARNVFSKYDPYDTEESISRALEGMCEKELENIRNHEAYFIRSVKNSLLNMSIKRNNQKKTEQIFATNLFGTHNSAVDMNEHHVDIYIEFIEKSLKHLSDGQADVIKLVLEDKTNAEIAIILNIEENNVKQRKYLATEELKELYRLSQDDFFNQ